MKIGRYLPAIMLILLFSVSLVAAQEFSLATTEGTSPETGTAEINFASASSDSGIGMMIACSDPDTYTMQHTLTFDSNAFGLSTEGCGGAEKQITFGSLNHVNPRVSDTKIVFEEWNNGVSSIGMYDIANGGLFPIYPGVQQQSYPDIGGKYIVYEQAGTKNNQVTNINVYDLQSQTSKPVAESTSNQNRPAVSGRFVVYEDWKSGDSNIYLADLNSDTTKALQTSLGDQKRPDISGNYVVWEDWRNGNADIYLYDISTETEKQLTSNSYNQKNPRISGNVVVFQDDRNGASDIFAIFLDTGKEVQLTFDNTNEINPDVSGPLVVWEDDRKGNADIYLLDLVSGRIYALTSDTADQKNPSIYAGRVAWQDYRTGSANIFMYTFSSSSTPSVPTSGSYQISGAAVLNNQNLPSGAVITAYVGQESRAQATVTTSGQYSMTIPVYQADNGKIITFSAVTGGSGYQASQQITVGQQVSGRYDLTFGSTSTLPYTIYTYSGSASFDTQYAPAGSIISARIDNQIRGQVTITTPGSYSGLNIPVYQSDNGKVITFAGTLNGVTYTASQQVYIGSSAQSSSDITMMSSETVEAASSAQGISKRLDLTFPLSTQPYNTYTYSGSASFDTQRAPAGSVISARIDNQIRGQVTVTSPGSYSGLTIPVYKSDNGKVISFTGTLNGVTYTASQQVYIGSSAQSSSDITMMSSETVEAASSAQGISKRLDLTFPLTAQTMYRFYGQAVVDGLPASAGTIINAVIDGQIRGQITVTTTGRYGSEVGPYLEVQIYPADIGKTIRFETSTGAGGDQSQLIVSGLTVKKNINFSSQSVAGVDFTASPVQGAVPLSVKFTDKSSGSPRAYFWDFGDGATSTDKNPTHKYTRNGIYSVGLQVTYWNGQVKSAVKSNLVTAGVVTPANARIGLNPGWNFISIPKMLADGQNNAKALFGHVDVGGHSIFAYNPKTKSWTTVTATTIINPLDAVWIYSQQADTVYLYFANDALQIPPTKKLVKGWNTFGVTSLNSVPASNALLSVKDQWIYVIGFESTTQRYQSTIMNVPESNKNTLYPGYGYWIYMSEEGELAALGL